ncbi:hypothetical protein [Finegoldia magna]|uniref:Uncharacterized protein n=1 Tax=Finegoldia magna TaxID=1260 RepID=A0A133N462_FINMA|nr:hypothetical protein [Finegoldia magna]MDU7114056.1 hypothetical protein [Peptoniphilus harei]MDU7142355.1 hypothetical protein [Anaerococcus vaginalis]EGS35330.1 hypothetical protein HMPREF9489_1659 [Finegoldia magna SY403409CC001050417]KXA11099.1 hypothetical protein HMPREF3217_00133 [Finegoldia magna]MDU1214339.1 hypothetical protein [Finegoldia magna]
MINIESIKGKIRSLAEKKNTFLRALKYNIFGLFIFGVSYFLKYDINKTHTKEILLILFLCEVCYWLTVVIGSLVIKKLKVKK